MTKASWGTKRNCPACNVAFYDLKAVPAVCPKCNHKFDPSVAVRAKRKTAKRSANEEDVVLQPTILAAKKSVSGKKQKKEITDDDTGDGVGELMEMDDADDIESLHELSELEEMEETLVNEDDADEEALIEELNTGENGIVENVEDEEAIAFVREISDEEQADHIKKKKTKK